jgi:hypothetical protein
MSQTTERGIRIGQHHAAARWPPHGGAMVPIPKPDRCKHEQRRRNGPPRAPQRPAARAATARRARRNGQPRSPGNTRYAQRSGGTVLRAPVADAVVAVDRRHRQTAHRRVAGGVVLRGLGRMRLGGVARQRACRIALKQVALGLEHGVHHRHWIGGNTILLERTVRCATEATEST